MRRYWIKILDDESEDLAYTGVVYARHWEMVLQRLMTSRQEPIHVFSEENDPESMCPSPGKFAGERRAVMMAYEASLEGVADEEFGDVGSIGYHARVDLGEPIGNVFLFEDNNGFVTEISEEEFEQARRQALEDES